MAALIGHEEFSNTPKRTQTFLATHDGEGKRLPLMYRSFLSFSYGGKHIEDFNLIATYSDRLSKQVYSGFEDITSDYTTIDGQYYWGTRMEPNELDFTLSTDWIDQKTLEEFKMWFRPGVERDLILAEHPNRYISARVADPPSISMIPFGEEAQIAFTNHLGTTTTYTTKTTVYRGDITLKFVMDQPYWTGILNYMPYIGGAGIDVEKCSDKVKDLLNQIIVSNSLTSEDAFKICLEDGIPHDISFYGQDNFLIGITQAYTKVILSRSPYAATITDGPDANTIVPENQRARTKYSQLTYISPGAETDSANSDDNNIESETTAVVYNYILEDMKGVDLDNETPQYLFYCGTAPSKPEIEFTLEIVIDNETGYITSPSNLIENGNLTYEHSYIKVGNKKFEFTTPGICTAYNKAVQIVTEIDETESIYNLKKEFREKVKDKYVRQWAINCLTNYDQVIQVENSIKVQIINNLKLFFKQFREYEYGDNVRIGNDFYATTLKFNSQTGEAIGKFYCQVLTGTTNGQQQFEYREVIENVGDMVLSNYLIIDERNYLNEQGLVIAGGENNNCTPITSNVNIYNFKILYDNMYY